MRGEWLIPVLLVMPFAARADNEAPESQFIAPSYKVLRFDENYSSLGNPTNRTQWLDQIKYLPLRPNDPTWYLTVGGELRERYEGNYDPNFGIGGKGPDSSWLQRVTLLSDIHLGDRVRIFAEGISGGIEGGHMPAPPVQDDPLDLQSAFVDVVPYLTDEERLTLRGGRFGMSFGSGRLVATRAGPNIPFRFDGGEVIYTRPLWAATAFLTRPVKDNGGISGNDPETAFWGLYLTHWLDTPDRLGIDVYYLGIAKKDAAYALGTGNETRHSFGTRIFGTNDHWDWNGEGVLQVGTFGDKPILAWTAAMDSGYTWEAALDPRLGLKVGVVSGNTDNNRLRTFNALYFKSGYFNDASLIRPQNLIGVHPTFALKLSRTVAVDGGANWMWRYTRKDAVYAVPGYIAIPALQNASSYIATAVDVNLQWQIQKHLTLGASFVHFLTGSYVQAAGGNDVNYVSTTLNFLF